MGTASYLNQSTQKAGLEGSLYFHKIQSLFQRVARHKFCFGFSVISPGYVSCQPVRIPKASAKKHLFSLSKSRRQRFWAHSNIEMWPSKKNASLLKKEETAQNLGAILLSTENAETMLCISLHFCNAEKCRAWHAEEERTAFGRRKAQKCDAERKKNRLLAMLHLITSLRHSQNQEDNQGQVWQSPLMPSTPPHQTSSNPPNHPRPQVTRTSPPPCTHEATKYTEQTHKPITGRSFLML